MDSITINLSKDVLERIIEDLIRISEAYQQRAHECEAKQTIDGRAMGLSYRDKSRTAAENARVLQLAYQAHAH